MNERIAQLAEQVVSLSRLHDGDFALMGNKQVEKFAELIVQECVDYCGENLSKTVGGALKIHFGVKE